MTTTTKIAFVRGIAQELQDRGYTAFRDVQTLKQAADMAGAHHLTSEPLVHDTSPHELAKIAQTIIYLSDQMEPQFKAASVQEQAFFTVDNFEDDVMDKIASWAGDYLDKVAAGQPVDGSPMMNNTIEQAAHQSGMGKREAERRPSSYADNGRGKTQMAQGGMLGQEMPHPDQQGHAKKGSAMEILNKLAMGTNQHGASPSGGQGDNSIEQAAQQSQMGKNEAERRPSDYANNGLGKSEIDDVPGSERGTEMPHPHGESPATKQAAWETHFRSTYEELSPILNRTNLSMEDQATLVKTAMKVEPNQMDEFKGLLADRLGVDLRPKQASLQTLLANMNHG